MSKEAAGPLAGESAQRRRSLSPAARAGVEWLRQRRWLVWVALVLGAASLAALYIATRRPGAFARGQTVSFPAPPNVDTAIAAAQERLKGDPQDINALVDLGTLHFQKGKQFYPDAINELEQARELGALDTRIFYCLGIMYQEVGLYPFALEEYQRYLRHYPDDKQISLLEAKLLYQQGRYPEAVSEYERLKFKFPNDPLVQENLGLSLWGAKDVDHAAQTFEALKTQGGDEARRAQFYLGEIALAQGKAQEAFADVTQALQAPGSVDFGIPAYQVDAVLAAAQQRLGRKDEARRLWAKVLTENPDDARAKQAKTALRRLGRGRGRVRRRFRKKRRK